ncbi:biotin/lipoyl-containing protein [Leucobacter ruminantium]|uniref:Lipoyl domain-containing protein n=1 Tax=Leucobacter ruminantium TaxID=1289170 RepID=A0A939LVX7_9MICO|nr:lipoyl domain-containing protein [Leucobacter ruminantium]
MATTYPMPKWGVTMESGQINEWTVSPGDAVKEGDIIASVSTDKIDIDFESPADGVIAALLADEGDDVECGVDVLVIADDQADYDAYRASQA